MTTKNRRTSLTATLLMALLTLSVTTAQAEFDRGQALYENHCQHCHEDRVHTRKNSIVKSWDSLQAWVASWSVHAGLNWSSQDINEVTRYLNHRYYQFNDSVQ